MPGSARNTAEKDALDAITKRGVTTYYLMLLKHTDAGGVVPTDVLTDADFVTNEITTPNSNGYVRPAVTWTDPGTTGETHASAEVTIGPLQANLVKIGYCALIAAATGTAEVRFYWTLDAAVDPELYDTLVFALNDLSIALD
jgi:hypothetical protein